MPQHSRPGDAPLDPVRAAADLPCHLASAGAARRLVVVEGRAAGLPEDVLEDLALLVSEVVANAVLHGRSGVRLALTIAGGAGERGVRVEVGDDNSRRPERQQTDADALDGRGLAVLQALASRWGVDDAPIGKVVWFELLERSGGLHG